MKWHRLALVTLLFLGLAALGVAGTDNAKQIVGVWKLTKAKDGPKEAQIEFTKDGKIKVETKKGEETFNAEGTYKVEGKKLTLELAFGEKTETTKGTIKKLDAKELVIVMDRGDALEFERSK